VSTPAYVALMVLAGAMIAFQGPVNAALARTVGAFEASFVSFAVGTIGLGVLVAVAGRGSLGGATQVPRWQLVGGLLGAVMVTSLVVAVPRIGLTAAMVASLTGQLATALVIDRFGLFGVPVRQLEWNRVLGVLLLVAAVLLINWREIAPGPR
jgi:bacterial/archaeal transporter family-2 protein